MVLGHRDLFGFICFRCSDVIKYSRTFRPPPITVINDGPLLPLFLTLRVDYDHVIAIAMQVGVPVAVRFFATSQIGGEEMEK